MIVGSNQLSVNGATVIAALQEYFNKRTTSEGKFTVKGFTNGSNNTWIVTIDNSESEGKSGK